MIGPAARRGRVSVLLAAVLVTGCRGDPTGPELPPLEVVIAGGDGQFGTVGQVLDAPLHVIVRVVETGLPRKDVTLSWTVEQGAAQIVGVPTTVTDTTGSATRTLQLGGQVGDVVVRVTAVEQEEATTTFVAHAIDRPTLTALTPSSVEAGDTVVLDGADFSPTADQDVVLFSGIRGRVLSATGNRLEVEVPPCLPAREVRVRVQLGVVASDSLPLTVSARAAQPRSLAAGEIVDVDDGLECLLLEGGVRYLAVVASASTVGAARHPFTLTGLVEGGGIIASHREVLTAPEGRPEAPPSLHDRLRLSEERMVRETPPGERTGTAGGAATVPVVGDTRTFNVLNAQGGFTPVSAVARHVGTRAALYVDDNAPSGGLDDADLAAYAARFDDVIHPEVVGAFGAASDLDSNQRVVIVFTPVVNGFTPRGSQGFVGGFFYGLDLLTGRQNSNGGEIFYMLVPDPAGTYSDARTKEQVLNVTPAILAHEFQHMVHFNQRVLVREASGTDALWLSEGLAQMAEESVARAYEQQGDDASTELFRSGNRARGRRYLADPAAVSLIVASGQGTLEERGGGWLHVLYLADRFGESILGALTQTTSTGVANVTAGAGLSWLELTSDWFSALYLDGIGPEDGRLEYPGVDLRTLLGPDAYPLSPREVGGTDFGIVGEAWSSSALYRFVEAPAGGSVALGLGGAAGSTSPASAALRLRIVRIP